MISRCSRFLSRAALAGIAITTVLLVLGCSTVREVYLHPLADPNAIKKIAILPFQNLGGDPQASFVIEEGFLVELLKVGSFSVINPGEVRTAIDADGIRPGSVNRAALAKIGARIECDAVLVGTVMLFDKSTPEVSLSAQILDVESGEIVWASSMGRIGRTDLPTFGVGETTSVRRLAQSVIHDMVVSIFGKGVGGR